jgi:hypothetical protein
MVLTLNSRPALLFSPAATVKPHPGRTKNNAVQAALGNSLNGIQHDN